MTVNHDDLHIPAHRYPLPVRVAFGAFWSAVALVVGFVLMAVITDRLNGDHLDHPNPPTTTTTDPVPFVNAAATATTIAHPPIADTATDFASTPDPYEYVTVQGQVYQTNAPHRPACWVEPSETPDGFEVILYPDTAMHHDGDLGFEVACPEPGQMPNAVSCQEDEIVTVEQDPKNLHPGLKWDCVNAEQYAAGERPHG